MKSFSERGNIIISVALAGGMILFMASVIKMGLNAVRPLQSSIENGSVQGVFIAQRSTLTPVPSGPTALPTGVRPTVAGQPSPYIKVVINPGKTDTVGLGGSYVCAAAFNLTVGVVGSALTTTCLQSSTNTYLIPYSQYQLLRTYTGIHIVPQYGYKFGTITSPDRPTGFTSASMNNDANTPQMGIGAGWPINNLPYTGFSTININVMSPTPLPAVANFMSGNDMLRSGYTPGQASTTPCTGVIPISTCNYGTFGPKTLLARCTYNGKVVDLVSGLYCSDPPPDTPTPQDTATPTPSMTPAPGCQYVLDACTNSIPPNCSYNLVCTTPSVTPPVALPTCADDCVLHPKGDATCEGNIDSQDYSFWLLMYKGLPIPGDLSGMRGPDFNDDGKVNLVDLQIWQDGLFMPPVAPTGPACTTSTTAPVGTSTPTPAVSACPAPQCANPPSGCSYVRPADGCSCGNLVCNTEVPTAAPTKVPTKVPSSPTPITTSALLAGTVNGTLDRMILGGTPNSLTGGTIVFTGTVTNKVFSGTFVVTGIPGFSGKATGSYNGTTKDAITGNVTGTGTITGGEYIGVSLTGNFGQTVLTAKP